MKRKIFAVLILTALVVGGASAQLMFGVTGAIPMDSTNFKAADVVAQLKEGNGVLYGFTGELAFRKLGFGVSANTMYYPDEFTNVQQIIDVESYISFHIIKARAFLDPFVELGAGLLGTINDDIYTNEYSQFLDASYYWYAGAGLGLNLGIIGVFTKFSMNFNVASPVTYTDMYGYEQEYPAFGSVLFGSAYIPAYKLTVGAKLIL